MSLKKIATTKNPGIGINETNRMLGLLLHEQKLTNEALRNIYEVLTLIKNNR